MILNIESDLNRFKQIVKGKLRKDLKKYMSSTELLGRQGNKTVSIPLPQIGLPRFRFGDNQGGGLGQGEGQGGQPAPGPAGEEPGEHTLEAEISLEELAEILGETLQLPRIQPRGKRLIAAEKDRYTGISRVGPEALRHNRRTFREALRRQIAGGAYDPARPRIVPVKEDKRYRTWNTKEEPQSAAVILYMMDVSGSMGAEQKEIVRMEAFWIDTWLRHNYKNVESRYIIHDAVAREVDRDTFFRTRESGGTLISSAYKLAIELLDAHYPAADWNIYPFHFSDGDNWSTNDTRLCMKLLEQDLLPRSNQFSYGQVDSEYGSGQFYKDLGEHFKGDNRLVTSRIANREAIMESIRTLLGKGR